MPKYLPLLLLVTTAAYSAPAPQTRPWRVAVIGGWSTGYLGLLALHGLPRARLDDGDLARPEIWKQYNVLITALRAGVSDQTEKDLEQYVRDGGILFLEGYPPPTTDAIAGKRLGPAPSTNLQFAASDSAITAGLPELGVLPTYGYTAAAIIPEGAPPPTILARFSDEGAPDKYRNNFVLNGEGAPAILLQPLGKGYLVYSGTSIGYHLSLRGRELEKFVVNALDALSQGQLRDRLYLAPADGSEALLTAPQPAPEAPPYPLPPGQAATAPPGFEKLEDADGLQDFTLSGKLPAQGEARALIGYWSPGNADEIVCAAGKVTARRLQQGKVASETSGALPSATGSVTITRRQGLIAVAQDGRCLLSAGYWPLRQGLLATEGLADPVYQPLEPVNFADDFMRESGEKGEWEPASGNWQVVASEGTAVQGVNPFNYQVSADANGAVSLAGEPFWSDLSCRVAVQTSAAAVGLLVDDQAPDRYHLLRLLVNADPKASRLQLVQRRPEGEQVLAEAPVVAARPDWHRIELRTSRGRLQGWLNHRLVLQATCDLSAAGRIGLYCQTGPASFDDVVVSPWAATPPLPACALKDCLITGGAWSLSPDGGTLSGSGRKGGRALAPWPAVADCQAQVMVRPASAEAAGLVLRSGPAGYLLVTLSRDGKGMKLVATRQSGKSVRLGEKTVNGDAGGWHALTASMYGPYLRVGVDGRAVFGAVDTAIAAGAPGLYARGDQAAQFRDFQAWQEDAPDQLADEPTPSFAGIIDRHTWAGRAAAWVPDPSDLNCLWHAGYFPGEVSVNAGLHPDGATATMTVLHLGPRSQPNAGYALSARRTWATAGVDLSLSLDGKPVAAGSANVSAATGYALRLERHGQDLAGFVNDRPMLAFHDSRSRPECDSLGIDNGGQPVHADDVAVTSPWVHDYTFETAPTDWCVESGTWKVSSRWSCSPGWSWFAGVDPSGPAMVATRDTYSGDMDLVTYVAAKMMPAGNSYSERLSDIHLAACATEGAADTGYHFILGGKANTQTVLLRDGQQVLESPWRTLQTAIHNDWLRLTLRRRGPKLSLFAWDSPIMEWTDPQPLSGGHIKLGTFQNGVLIPRVTIFGKQEGLNLLPEMAIPAPSAPPATATTPPAKPASLAIAAKPLFTFAADQAPPEFGGEWGLWPQNTDCQGTATFVPEDAEGGPGGCLKITYTIKADPKSFSVWLTSPANVDFSAYDRFVIYVRGDVLSFTLVVKDRTAADPAAPVGIADCVVKKISPKWQRLEIPFKAFIPRQKGAKIDWKTINHLGIAMIAPQNAESGTFWVDNLRAEVGGRK